MKHLPALTTLLLLPSLAFAYPTAERGALDGGSGTSGLTVSATGQYIATAQRASAGLAIWDRLAPNEPPTLVDVCEATDAVFARDPTRGESIYVACGNNEVVRVTLDTDAVPPTATVGDPITVGLETESVVALAWTQNDDVVHVVTSGSSVLTLHAIDLSDDSVDGFTGLPLQTNGTPVDLAVAPVTGTGTVIIPTTSGGWSWATRSGTTYTGGESLGVAGTADAIAVDSSGAIGSFVVSFPTDGELWTGSISAPGTTPQLWNDTVSSPRAIAWVPQSSSAVLFSASSASEVTVLDSSGEELDTIALSSTGSPVAILADPTHSDTVYVAGGDGAVQVLSTRPWVTSLSAASTSLTEGEETVVTFTVDADVDWDLRLGAGISATSGSSLASGTAEADEEVSVTISTDDLDTEGENRLVLFAEDAGDIGVDSLVLTLDTPPDGVTAVTVEPGDSRLLLSWTSTDEADIDHYLVYVSESAFTSTGTLPALTVEDADGETIEYPVEVAAGDPLTAHSTSLLGLTNGTTYWVAVQAVDSGGAEGPVSVVVSGAPELTCGLVECYGDPGCGCSAVDPRPAAGWASLLAACALLGRRRRA